MFLQSIQEYPTLYMILLAAVSACAILWVLAMRSAKKRRMRRDALIADLERGHALRREFTPPTREKFAEAPPERLIEGLCARIQARLEENGTVDLRAAYDALPQLHRHVYALGYVIQDGHEALSGFFKANGPPLTDAALEAVLRFLGEPSASIFQLEFDAFDERNEAVSLVRETIDSQDRQWRCQKEAAGEAFYREAKEAVLANCDAFLC